MVILITKQYNIDANMTNQELYNQTVRDIINQGGPSVGYYNGHTVCLFRGLNNRKCVAGFRIPDEEYFSEMETSNFSNEKFKNIFKNLNIHFLRKLQYIHDESALDFLNNIFYSDSKFFEIWIPNMISLAKEEELDSSIFESFNSKTLQFNK